jgi:hypothetical protein
VVEIKQSGRRKTMKSLSLFLLLFTTMAAQAATLPPTWKVSYMSGALPASEAKVLLTVDSGHLTFKDKQQAELLQIAASQISTIVYSTERFRRTKQVGFSLSDYQYCGQGCGGILLLNVVALMFAAPLHGHNHYLTVNWTDNGVDQAIMFETRKNDLKDLTNALRQFQGVRWLDMESEGRKLKAEIAQNREKVVSISLDRVSKAGDFDLSPGRYQVLVLERTPEKADVYFFTNKVDASKIKAVMRGDSTVSEAPTSVEYSPNTSQITAIHLPGKTLSFAPGQTGN